MVNQLASSAADLAYGYAKKTLFFDPLIVWSEPVFRGGYTVVVRDVTSGEANTAVNLKVSPRGRVRLLSRGYVSYPMPGPCEYLTR